MTIALEPRDPAGLAAFATQVSTPGSPLFGHFLTVEQFAARFGSTNLRIAAVQSALRSQGLTVGPATANDLTIPVTGTASQVQKAFSVSLAQVRLPTGRTAYANQQAPALPASISSYVQGIVGLDNVAPDQPAGPSNASQSQRGLKATRSQAGVPRVNTGGGPQPCSAAQAQQANHGLTADELATAYQFSSLYGAGDLGAGQTIAMFEEQPYDPVDIASYQACYQTAASVSNVDVDGGPGPYQPPPGSGDGESALDIETAIGLAPKANILVYEGPSPVNSASSTVDIISTIVSQNRAKVISSSYGVCEALTGGTVINAENTLLQEAAAQGQTFLISSGDSGSTMCFQAKQTDTSLSVIDPGGQPFATGVGGTTLYASSGGSDVFYQPGMTPLEGVWNDGVVGSRLSGTGGGISSFFQMPSYQSGAPNSLGVVQSSSSAQPCGGSTFCREVPDVAADADLNTGYVMYTDGSWGIIGGTSAAAPLWASFIALANASPTCRGQTIGFANPSLYQIAGSSYLSNFHDITLASPFTGAANNDTIGAGGFSNPDNPNHRYPLASGYDMATGLGSMIAPTLAGSLCSLRSPVYTVGVASPGPQLSIIGHPASLQVSGSDSGAATLTYTASGLPTGLAISPSGLISGRAAAAGTFTVTLSASDPFTNAGSTQFSWRVVAPGAPASSHVSLSNLAKRKAKLTFTVAAGSFAPALRSVAVSLPSGLSFAKQSTSLSKGIVVKAAGKRAKFRARVSRGALTLTFNGALQSATITIGSPAIVVSSQLASKVHRRKVKRLTVLIKTVDASNTVTRIPLTLKT